MVWARYPEVGCSGCPDDGERSGYRVSKAVNTRLTRSPGSLDATKNCQGVLDGYTVFPEIPETVCRKAETSSGQRGAIAASQDRP
jgi:hypothetical protein